MPINKAVRLLGNITFLHFNGFLNIPGRVNDFPTIKFWVHPRHAVFKDEKPDLGFVLLLFFLSIRSWFNLWTLLGKTFIAIYLDLVYGSRPYRFTFAFGNQWKI